MHDLGLFKELRGAIATSLWIDDLADVAGKVYTRDPFRQDRVFHIVLFQSSVASAAGNLSLLLRIFQLIPFGMGMCSHVLAFYESAAARSWIADLWGCWKVCKNLDGTGWGGVDWAGSRRSWAGWRRTSPARRWLLGVGCTENVRSPYVSFWQSTRF